MAAIQSQQQQQQSSTTKENKIFNNQWILKRKVSAGSFGVVFIGILREIEI